MPTVYTGIENTGTWDWFQDNQGWTYLANGSELPQIWDGISGSSRNWGLPPIPLGSPVTFNSFIAGALTGNYVYYASLYNSLTDVEGAHGPASAVMTPAAQGIKVNRPAGITTLDPQATHWRLWRNTTGATTWYRVADVPIATATYDDTMIDDVLSVQPLTLNVNNPKIRIPAQHPYIALHGGFAFGWGGIQTQSGALVFTGGSPIVTGAANMTQAFVGMNLRIIGPAAETKVYTIKSVESISSLTLTENYAGASSPPNKTVIIYPKDDSLASWSLGGRYEEFRLFNQVSVGSGDGGTPTGIFTLLDALYLAKDRSLYRWNFSTNPNPINGDAGIFNVLRNRGLLNFRCRVVVGPHAYMMDRKGIYRFEGDYEETQIDRQIKPLIMPSYMPAARRINWAQASKFHGVHDPKEDRVVFFVALDQDVEPHHSFSYDRRRDRWHVERYDSAITGSLQMRDAEGKDRTFIGDEFGYVRGFAVNPGLDATGPTVAAPLTIRGTVTAADASSMTDSTATFDPGAASLVIGKHAGSYVEIYEGVGAGQTRRIGNAISNTVLAITPNWGTVPGVGAKYRVGAIEEIIETQNFSMAPISPNELKEARFLRVFFEPREDWPESWIGLTLFKDWSQSPFLGWSPKARVNGLEIPSTAKLDGEIRAYVDHMTGAVQVTLGHEFARAWRVKLRYKEAGRPIPITGLEIAGAIVPRQDWRDQ